MTVPGGVPNLPQGALTLDTLASKTQDMTPTAMRQRAAERMPGIFDGSTGGNPLNDLSPFGVLTAIWAEVNSLVANADPADIQGPEDLPPLLLDFIESLPVVGELVGLLEAILGTYDGDDEVLLTVQNIFAPIRDFFNIFLDLFDGTAEDGTATIIDLLDGTATLDDVFGHLFNADGTAMSPATMLQNLSGLQGTLQGLWDSIVGGLSGDDQTAGSEIHNIFTTFQETVNNIVGGLFGFFLGGGDLGGNNFGFGNIGTATNNTASSLVSLSQAIATLMQGVVLAEVDFTALPASTSLPGSFATTYIGTGAATRGVSGGLGDWRNVEQFFSFTRQEFSRYTPTQTTGDDQIICVVFGSVASPGTYNTITGRMDSAGTTRTEVVFADDVAYLTCVVAGVQTIFASIPHAQKAGSPYYLKCGAGGNPRTLQLIDGNNVILPYTDGGAVSSVGSGFRYGGMGSSYYTVSSPVIFLPNTAYRSGRVAYWSINDG